MTDKEIDKMQRNCKKIHCFECEYMMFCYEICGKLFLPLPMGWEKEHIDKVKKAESKIN